MPQDPIEIVMNVVDNVDVMLGYWDRDLRCRFANAAYQVWFGKSRQELIGISMKELLGPLFELNLPHIQAVLKGEVQVFEREITLPDGSTRHSLASYYPDISNGIVQGFTVQVVDVTRLKNLEFELQAAREQAELLATHDFLTGLPNRVLLLDRISSATARAERCSGLVGIIAIDVDDFKQINDKYGHNFGDEVLKQIAERMKSVIRATDTVTRLGGDEFIYLASELGSIGAIQSAVQRLQKAVCCPMQCQKTTFTPSLSFGIAVFPSKGTSTAELLTAADRALYEAKKRGKNCFVFAK